MEQMNILVTLDKNYILPLRTMLHSLLRSNPDMHFHVYVGHSSLTEKDFACIRKGVHEAQATIIPAPVQASLLDDAPILNRLSKETYYRLIAASYLPESVDRVLYLDPDIHVNLPLSDFYNMDMQGNLLAGAGHLDGFLRWLNLARLKMKKTKDYVNAGVLLMDLGGIRALDNTHQIFDFVRKNKRKLYLGDQDVVNAFYDGRILLVPAERYNLDEKYYRHCVKTRQMDLDWVKKNTVLIHFNGSEKPWKPDYEGSLGDFFFENRAHLEAEVGECV